MNFKQPPSHVVSFDRKTLETVNAVLASDVAGHLARLTGGTESRGVYVIFSNNNPQGTQSSPTSEFRVEAFVSSELTGYQIVCQQRQLLPWATFRLLEIFDGAFTVFVEFPPVEDENDNSNA